MGGAGETHLHRDLEADLVDDLDEDRKADLDQDYLSADLDRNSEDNLARDREFDQPDGEGEGNAGFSSFSAKLL